jgi:ATP-dependent helicase/nuclease subunit B
VNITSIPPHARFLDALAADWLDTAGDPLEVADGLILLPTRRAARALAEAFLRQSNGRPLLLPRITAFGALDESPLALAGAMEVPEAVAEPVRLAQLTRLVMALDGRFGAPPTADRAWPLAAELAALMDEAERAEVDLPAILPTLAAEDFARHWQVTLEFLRIVTTAWPAWLAENGLMNPAARQVALVDAQTASWEADPPAHRVVVAGTTGAIPSVARLMRVAAGLPQGRVVLPGLDFEMADEAWEQAEDTHPQAGLRRLLGNLGATRGDVSPWLAERHLHPPTGAAREGVPAERTAALARALLPAEALAGWRNASPVVLDGLMRLSPADQQEEAAAIALVLRDALETPGARAALVTPDRDLAGRVATELARFGVTADDSAGEKLAETPPAVFLRLLARAATEHFTPVALLALVKHPLAAAGLATAECRAQARRLERDCLRGPAPAAGLDGIRAVATRDSTGPFLDRIAQCLAPLLAIAGAREATPEAALAALIESGEALAATPEQSGSERLWSAEEGEALASHMAALQEAVRVLPPQPPVTLPGLLDAALEGVAVRSRRALRGRSGLEHPRVYIWGLLEARLQSAETIVLGGLAEGAWPPATDPGPWMSRQMRAAAGLPSPEERVGQMAHDFVMAACAAPTVVLSCPRRRDGAPAVRARWLVRIEAMLRGTGQTLPEHPAAHWARALDLPHGQPVPVLPPTPRPPLDARPRKLSVTEIETWLRDPYGIYARHILRLRALDPLEQSADQADYGSIVHDGMKEFLADIGSGFPPDAEARLARAMDSVLDRAALRPALTAWWRPRLRRIAAWIAGAERDRRMHGPLPLVAAERKGSWQLPVTPPFELSGRADRIELRPDGSLAILDYKTGTVPDKKTVEAGLAPQLALEAAMAAAGAFGDDVASRTSALVYWHLSGGYEPGRVHDYFADPAEVAKLAAEATAGLLAHIAAFDDPAQPYLSQPHPGAAPRYSNYTQLARVAEWAALGDGDE